MNETVRAIVKEAVTQTAIALKEARSDLARARDELQGCEEELAELETAAKDLADWLAANPED